MAKKKIQDMAHSWAATTAIAPVCRFVSPARPADNTEAFSGTAKMYIYTGEHDRLFWGAVVTFEGLTLDEQADLMVTASGVVADAVLKAAGLARHKVRLAGPAVIGVDLGAPIGDTGDIAGGRARGKWTLAFTSR